MRLEPQLLNCLLLADEAMIFEENLLFYSNLKNQRPEHYPRMDIAQGK